MDFIDASAALNIVRFDGEQFLQSVCSAIGLQRPDFHFAKALAAILRLASQRLLRDQAVRADGTRVDLVRHQMAQFHHVDVTDNNLLIEGFSGAAIVDGRFAGLRDPGEVFLRIGLTEIFFDFFLGNAVETGVATLKPKALAATPR